MFLQYAYKCGEMVVCFYSVTVYKCGGPVVCFYSMCTSVVKRMYIGCMFLRYVYKCGKKRLYVLKVCVQAW